MTAAAATTKSYEVDTNGFLVRPGDWDEGFAVSQAPLVGITTGLTDKHWQLIRFVRRVFEEHGQVPSVYVTCLNNRFKFKDLKRLFPAGYHRGVCRLAGASYWTGYYHHSIDRESVSPPSLPALKVYRTDALGFLVDSEEWDESFAVNKAAELKMAGGLTGDHWRVIRYLRDSFKRSGVLPTVYAACEDNGLEATDLERLFPDGYHRGAVKLAGLRFR